MGLSRLLTRLSLRKVPKLLAGAVLTVAVFCYSIGLNVQTVQAFAFGQYKDSLVIRSIEMVTYDREVVKPDKTGIRSLIANKLNLSRFNLSAAGQFLSKLDRAAIDFESKALSGYRSDFDLALAVANNVYNSYIRVVDAISLNGLAYLDNLVAGYESDLTFTFTTTERIAWAYDRFFDKAVDLSILLAQSSIFEIKFTIAAMVDSITGGHMNDRLVLNQARSKVLGDTADAGSIDVVNVITDPWSLVRDILFAPKETVPTTPVVTTPPTIPTGTVVRYTDPGYKFEGTGLAQVDFDSATRTVRINVPEQDFSSVLIPLDTRITDLENGAATTASSLQDIYTSISTINTQIAGLGSGSGGTGTVALVAGSNITIEQGQAGEYIISSRDRVGLVPGMLSAYNESSTGALLWLNKTAASGDLLRLQTSGTDKILVDYDGNLTVAGVVLASNGTELLPAYSFASDTDTGIFRAGANILALSTAGTERLRVDADGNVVVGTSSAQAGNILTIQGNTYLAGNVSTTGNTTLGNATTDTITFTGTVASDIVPNTNSDLDLGSTSFYWQNAYVQNVFANNIQASGTNIAGTTADSFTLNSDNATSDAEDSSLVFYRGLVSPNAVFRWDSTADNFELSQNVVVQNETPSTGSTLFTVKGGAGQAGTIFDIQDSSAVSQFSVGSTGNVTGGTYNGQTISSAANFTGTLTAATSVSSPIFTSTGSVVIKPGTNSTTAFQVQNAGGTYIINVDTSNGRVGIGTNAPAALFSIGASSEFQVSAAGAVTAVGVNSGSGLLQGTGGLTLTGTTSLNASGSAATNIGTGTSSGTVTIGNASTSDLALVDPQWSVTGAGVATFASINAGAVMYDSLSVGGGYGSTGTTITGTGNISTNGNLVVDGTTTSSSLLLSSSSPFIRFVDSSLGTSEYQIRNGEAGTGILDIYDATAGASRFKLGSDGKFSIGNANPLNEAMLYVYGNSTNGANVDIRSSTTATPATIEVQADDFETSLQSAYLQYNGSGAIGNIMDSIARADAAILTFQQASNALIYTDNSAPIIFGTNDDERLRITATGNVGIGDISPAAMFTVGSGDLFQVNSSGAIAAATGITSSGSINFSGLTTNGVVYTSGGTGTLNTEAQLSAVRGGTGIGTYAVGDILYADTTSSLARLADVATGNVLLAGGVGVAPSWGQVALGTHTTGNYVSTITGTANQITASASTGAITLSLPSDLRVPGTLNAISGVYTGAGAGTQRIDASGNLVNIGTVTSGLINGQTISSSTNFTGTVAIATSVTSPITYGGTSASSTLTLAGTSNGTPSNAHIVLNGSSQGNVGIGDTSPAALFTVGSGDLFQVSSAGNVYLESERRYTAGNTNNYYLELQNTSWGQGMNLVSNATYSGSGDPLTNSTYKVNAGSFNTGAGLLRFDGNAKTWSARAAVTSTGSGNAITWIQMANLTLNSSVWLSPRGTSSDFYINSSGSVGIGNASPSAMFSVGSSSQLQVTSAGATTISSYLRVGSNTAPANTTTGDLTATRLSVGNGTLSSAGGSVAALTGTVTDTAAGSVIGINTTLTLNPAGTSASEFRTFNMSATVGSGNAQTFSDVIQGSYNEVRMLGTGSITQTNAVRAVGVILPSAAVSFGTITDAVSLLAIPVSEFSSSSITGTITNSRGLRVNNISKTHAGVVVTNQAGITIEALSGATNNTAILIGQTSIPTGSFGIYSSTANNSYFAGNVGIGDESPAALLTVGSGDLFQVASNGTISTTTSTLTSDINALNITSTWNSAGTTFTGIKYNVTNTASGANSLLADLQIGGISQFAFKRDGSLRLGMGSGTGTDAPHLGLFSSALFGANTFAVMNSAGSRTNIDINKINSASGFFQWNGTRYVFRTDSEHIDFGSDVAVRFSSTTSAAGSKDVGLERNSVGVLRVTDGSTGTGSLLTGNIYGSTSADGDLILEGTSNATKTTSYVILQPTSGNVGIGTSTPATNLHVSASAPRIRVQDTASGATALAQTMAGVELYSTGMNSTSQYTPAIKFGSADIDFTTTNPKFLAGIAGQAYETYSGDSDGGMGLSFFYSPDDAGTAPTPTVGMLFNNLGYLGLGATNPAARLHIQDNFSRGAWGTNGTLLRVGAVTVTSTEVAGTTTNQVFSAFQQPTLANTNAVTTTHAANLYVGGAPIAGTNSTITNAYSLWVDDGPSRFDGAITIGRGGVPISALHVIPSGAGASIIAGTPGTTGSWFQVAASTFTDSNTAASGTATNHVFNAFAQPTLAATNLTVTTTNAANVYIANAPAAGTNQTITNAYALWVDGGTSRFDANVTVGGTTAASQFDVSASTGGVITLSREDTSVLADDSMGTLQWWGNDTSTTTQKIFANIEVQSVSSIGSDVAPGRMIFRTTAVSAGTSPVEAMRIASTQNVSIGTQADPTGRLTVGGDISRVSWTTAGVQLQAAAATYTDTSGSGTIASRVVSSFAQPTLASSSAVTLTDAATLYVANAPAAGTNTTITNAYSLWVDAGISRFDGTIGVNSAPSSLRTVDITANGSDTNTLIARNSTANSTNIYGYNTALSGTNYAVMGQVVGNNAAGQSTAVTGLANGTTLTNIGGSFLASGGTNNIQLLLGTQSGPSGSYGIYNSSTSDNYLAGELGIGTATPGTSLHVVTSGTPVTPGSSTVAVFQRNTGTGTDATISIIGGNAATSQVLFGDADSETAGRVNYSHALNAMRFYTNGSERVSIDSSGNVNIGTGTVAAKLQVNDGNFRLDDADVAHGFTTLVATTTALQAEPLHATLGGGLISGFGESAGTGLALRGLIGAGDPGDTVPAVQFRAGKQTGTTGATLGALETAYQFSDWDGGTDWVTILGSGNFGIGDTTPAALFTVGNGDLFQVDSSGAVIASSGALESLTVGGGYGSTGTSINSLGFITTDGNITTGGSVSSSTYTASGAVAIKPGANSIAAVQIQNVAGNNIFDVDTTNSRIGIGTAAPSAILHVVQPARDSVTPEPVLKLAGGAHTNMNTAEAIDADLTGLARTVNFLGGGTVATQRTVAISAPTFTGLISTTITDASTVAITGAPIKSTNVTLTNTHALLISANAVSTATRSYGLTVNAQTGATTNYAAAFLGGNVGIGTSTPGSRLDVYNATASSNTDIFRVISDVGSTANTKFRIDSDGDVFTDGSTTIGTPADLAENYEVDDESIEAGDLVSLANDGLKVQKTSEPYEANIVSVISDKPGILLSGDLENSRPVVLSGRTPVKVNLENGPIKAGDAITSSTEAGVGMKAIEPGMIVGYALGDYDGTGDSNLVMTYVRPGFYFGSLEDLETPTVADEIPEQPSILDGFTLAIKHSLSKLGLLVENGILKVRHVIADTITARKAKINKLEMVDQATGDIYCTWIANGEWVKVQADCDNAQAPAPVSSSNPSPSPEPEPEPIPEPEPTPEPEPVVVSEPEPEIP